MRAATPADAPVIWQLLNDLAVYEKAPVFTLTEAEVARDMLGGACHCELAFRDGEPVGIATWFWIYMSFRARRGLYLEDLFVRPQARGHGLGKMLLAHLAAKARAANGFMEWRVLDWNEPALAFYQGLGAKPVAQWLNYRLEGAALDRLGT
nr:Acetyltransferase (GNAT) family [uncultured bacterium]